MKGKEANNDKRKVLISKMKELISQKTQKQQSLIEGETWKRMDNTEMTGGECTCGSIYMYGALTHRIKTDLCIRSRKTGD